MQNDLSTSTRHPRDRIHERIDSQIRLRLPQVAVLLEAKLGEDSLNLGLSPHHCGHSWHLGPRAASSLHIDISGPY
jgi:hypothetical protein